MRKQGNVVGKIFLLFIFMTIANIYYTNGTGVGFFQNISPFVWVFVFFLGVRLIASYLDRVNNQRRPVKDKEILYQKEEKPVEKDEYGFDDEFKIDPKDYE